MTVIIPLKNDGHYDQLRFALRSITKHHNITQCILVGGKPGWYTGDHIVHKDYGPDFKEQNIRDKVIKGSESITGSFLFANDDHILLSPLLTVWDKGLLADNISIRRGNGSYSRMLNNTFDHYGNVPNVDCHCPMWMTADGVLKTNFEWPRFGIGFKTCYAQENGLSSEFMEDCKTDKLLPLDRQWFSITDNYPLHNLTKYFPEKSIFEL